MWWCHQVLMHLATQTELRGHNRIWAPLSVLITSSTLEVRGKPAVRCSQIKSILSFCSLYIASCFILLFSGAVFCHPSLMSRKKKTCLWSSCYAWNVDSACSWHALLRFHGLHSGFIVCQHEALDEYHGSTDKSGRCCFPEPGKPCWHMHSHHSEVYYGVTLSSGKIIPEEPLCKLSLTWELFRLAWLLSEHSEHWYSMTLGETCIHCFLLVLSGLLLNSTDLFLRFNRIKALEARRAFFKKSEGFYK